MTALNKPAMLSMLLLQRLHISATGTQPSTADVGLLVNRITLQETIKPGLPAKLLGTDKSAFGTTAAFQLLTRAFKIQVIPVAGMRHIFSGAPHFTLV